MSPLTLTLTAIVLTIAILLKLCRRHIRHHSPPPTPFWCLPIVGHLPLLCGTRAPHEAIASIARRYGAVVALRLGSVRCVIVSGKTNISRVLASRGRANAFDARPNFERYQRLFCGNRDNSLAFCDWSHTQKLRRDVLRAHTFPRPSDHAFDRLDRNIIDVAMDMIKTIKQQQMALVSTNGVAIKPILLQSCADIFVRYFCTKQFDQNDHEFQQMIYDFDEIFYEVNRGYLADFLPFLMPFHQRHLSHVNTLTHSIRQFVIARIYDRWQGEHDDYVKQLHDCVKRDELSEEMALYALEDILGGHSAVANFLVKLLVFVAREPTVQDAIYREIVAIGGNDGVRVVSIGDRHQMPYTESVIYETVRMVASPIVPRVASRDAQIDGFMIEKDSVIFLNNYELNMSNKLWAEPKKFRPERFIENGRVIKPEHFQPFGGGRRSCMGYRMVQLVGFGLLSAILQNYRIGLVDDGYGFDLEIGSLALPSNTFRFTFIDR